MRQKHAIILRASGGELANQLWNYASVYAYALERGYAFENPAFYEYGLSFAAPAPSWWLKLAFFLPFLNYTKRKTSFRRRVWRKFYLAYAALAAARARGRIVSVSDLGARAQYLPPSAPPSDRLRLLEETPGDICFDGWLFRNPAGLEAHRAQIKERLRPRADIAANVAQRISALRGRYGHVVGVHVRQGDYLTWRGGAYAIDQVRVRAILDEYVSVFGLDADRVAFLIASDGPIDATHFEGLNVTISQADAVTDLFSLAAGDVVIGSNSTFGAFAAYYGNIPFIVMQKGEMDWEYQRNSGGFRANKYSTWVYY